jgi:uncharacterized protein
MRIAVIGAGISGNAAAWALTVSTEHDITIYEREERIGGHSATVDIVLDGQAKPVDTGFIVYNELNYPNLTNLFAHLGVATDASDMSFSVSARGGAFEWSGRTTKVLDGLFARRRNIVSPGYLRMLTEVFRFNKNAVIDRHAGRLKGITLGEYLTKARYSKRFREDYLLPMGAAIWSTPTSGILEFPAESFVTFFENHRLLHWNRPAWRTVSGGSRAYVEKLTAPFQHLIRRSSAVTSITRDEFGVSVTDANGQTERYDQVIIAAHSDEALAMLGDASANEQNILGAIGFRPNDVWLHRDPSLMPRRKAAWAAWNVLNKNDANADVCLTYWMNVLQPSLGMEHPVFVTLNPAHEPRADLVLGRYSYAHPQYDTAALAAQSKLPTIQGVQRTWFCGAWTGYGFHEDGLTSGLAVAEALGAVVPWRVEKRRFAQAAE